MTMEIYEFYNNNEIPPFNSHLSSICCFLSLVTKVKNINHSEIMLHIGFEKGPHLPVSEHGMFPIACDEYYKVRTVSNGDGIFLKVFL